MSVAAARAIAEGSEGWTPSYGAALVVVTLRSAGAAFASSGC